MRTPANTPPGTPIISQKAFYIAQLIWYSVPPRGEVGISAQELATIYGPAVNPEMQELARAGVLFRTRIHEKNSYLYVRESPRVRIRVRNENGNRTLVEAIITGVPNIKKVENALLAAQDALNTALKELANIKRIMGALCCSVGIPVY